MEEDVLDISSPSESAGYAVDMNWECAECGCEFTAVVAPVVFLPGFPESQPRQSCPKCGHKNSIDTPLMVVSGFPREVLAYIPARLLSMFNPSDFFQPDGSLNTSVLLFKVLVPIFFNEVDHPRWMRYVLFKLEMGELPSSVSFFADYHALAAKASVCEWTGRVFRNRTKLLFKDVESDPLPPHAHKLFREKERYRLRALARVFNLGDTYTREEVYSRVKWHLPMLGYNVQVDRAVKGLIAMGLLERTPDGAKYWAPPPAVLTGGKYLPVRLGKLIRAGYDLEFRENEDLPHLVSTLYQSSHEECLLVFDRGGGQSFFDQIVENPEKPFERTFLERDDRVAAVRKIGGFSLGGENQNNVRCLTFHLAFNHQDNDGRLTVLSTMVPGAEMVMFHTNYFRDDPSLFQSTSVGILGIFADRSSA